MFFVYQDHLSNRLRTNTCPPPKIKTTRLVDNHAHESCLAVANMTQVISQNRAVFSTHSRVHCKDHLQVIIIKYTYNCHGTTKTHNVHNYLSGYPGQAWSLRGVKSGHIISAKGLASWTSRNARQT